MMLRLSIPLPKAADVDRNRERTLIQAIQQGDREAFTELYHAYVDKIYRYIYARVSSESVADDLTGDVFVRVLEGLPSYEVRSTPIIAWIYRIAHDRVVDYYRLSKKTDFHEDLDSVQIS